MKRLPTWVEVDLDKFIANVDAIRSHVGTNVEILLTVKADAYGHGAVQVARAARGRVRMFGVATLDEAIELRESGATDSILILSPILETEIPAVAHGGFAVTLSSFGFAEKLSNHASQEGVTFTVHVEVDTGMGRTGVDIDEAFDEIGRIATLPMLTLEGIYTHFPVSDTDPHFTRNQVLEFEQLIAALRAAGISVAMTHSANTAAVTGIAESHMQMVRPGLLAYGLHPAGEANPCGVAPVMSWKSRIVRVRRMRAGSSISYGRAFTCKRDSVIGVVPVGYGHGYPLAASEKAQMLVGGERVPVVGRVTMDMTMVDLTDVAHLPAEGDEVVLVGGQGKESIDFHELADWAGTICYEIMCGISKRVPRTYLRRGRVETFKSLLGVLPNRVVV